QPALSVIGMYYTKFRAHNTVYTNSLHDALPILCSVKFSRTGKSGKRRGIFPAKPGTKPVRPVYCVPTCRWNTAVPGWIFVIPPSDRKSTRLNSSHVKISYAVFCLKKKSIVASDL